MRFLEKSTKLYINIKITLINFNCAFKKKLKSYANAKSILLN